MGGGGRNKSYDSTVNHIVELGTHKIMGYTSCKYDLKA
jgi:hypothetical protein